MSKKDRNNGGNKNNGGLKLDFPVSWLNIQGDIEKSYSPQMHAALAVYFQQLITGEKVEIKQLSEVAGVSQVTMRREISKIKKRIADLLDLL